MAGEGGGANAAGEAAREEAAEEAAAEATAEAVEEAAAGEVAAPPAEGEESAGVLTTAGAAGNPRDAAHRRWGMQRTEEAAALPLPQSKASDDAVASAAAVATTATADATADADADADADATGDAAGEPMRGPAATGLAAVAAGTRLPACFSCSFCGGCDDGGECGRMLHVEPGCHVHLHCAFWSSEVVEQPAKRAAEPAELTRLQQTLKSARKALCAGCGQPGASMGCNLHKCKRLYHFACAREAGGLLLQDRRLYCFEHRTHKQAQAKGCVPVPRGEPLRRGLRAQPSKRHQLEANPTLQPEQWLRVGALTVLRAGVSTAAAEPPVGLLAWRRHWSTRRPGEQCGYQLEILPAITHGGGSSGGGGGGGGGGGDRGGGVLRFVIVGEHEPQRPIEAASAQAAMEELGGRVRAVQPKLPDGASGSYPLAPGYFFGWLHAPVQRALHGEPAEAPEPQTVEAPLPVNRSGSARSEGYKKRPVVRVYLPEELGRGSAAGGDKVAKRFKPRGDKVERVAEEEKVGIVERLRGLNAQARARLRVSRSGIHGWGLFVKEPISKGEMLVEYQGLVIRASHTQAMLKKYERAGVAGCHDGGYIFKIDEAMCVDATMAGNIARFMNHSCAPNAISKIVEVGGGSLGKKVVVFAKRDLQVGEELQYDYQFALGEDKIACHCGAPNCWGRMN